MKRQMTMRAQQVAMAVAAGLTLAGTVLAGPAGAQGFEFARPPAIDLNRIYRVDRTNGEMSACQYGPREGGLGNTVCLTAGEGAGPQKPGDYALIASAHEHETGVFRVDRRSGAVSVCFVQASQVVCTPANEPPAPAPVVRRRPARPAASAAAPQ